MIADNVKRIDKSCYTYLCILMTGTDYNCHLDNFYSKIVFVLVFPHV